MTNIIDLLGRILISTLFLLNGIFKISNYEGTIGWMESFGVSGMFLVPAIILEIAGPILIIIGFKTRLCASILVIFTISVTLIFHMDFNNQMQLITFLKNISIAGGLLIIVASENRYFSIDNFLKNKNK